MTQTFCVCLSFFLSIFVDYYSFFPFIPRSYSTCQGDASCNWRRTAKHRGFNSSCSAHFWYQLHICARSLSLSSREIWMRSDFTHWLWEPREIWDATRWCVKLKKVSRNMFLLFHEKIYVSDVDPRKVEVCLTFIIRKRKNSKKFAVLKRNGKKN